MLERKPLFFGVDHGFSTPSANKIFEHLENNLKPGVKVGVELSEREVRELRKADKGDFFFTVIRMVERKGGKIVPIDSHYGRQVHLKLIEESGAVPLFKPIVEKMTADQYAAFKKSLKASVLRSRGLLRRALSEQTDINIIGTDHAFDIKTFAPSFNEHVKLLADPSGDVQKYLSEEEINELAARFKKVKPMQS